MKKTHKLCSRMAFDQALEQNNKITKSRAGFVDLLNKENTSFLRKLENIMPEVNDFLGRIRDNSKGQSQLRLKEAMQSFVKKYLADCRLVLKKVTENPFVN